MAARWRVGGLAFGFRYLLVLEYGEPADPGMFLTAIPTWKPGDTLLVGSDLRRFRILDVDTEQTPADANGVFTAEQIERQRA